MSPPGKPLFSGDRFRRFRLQTVLIVPFVVQVVAAVSLTGYLSIRNGQKAVRDLATQLLDKTEKLVEQHLESYLTLPHQINELNLDAIARGQIDLQNLEASARYFWKQSRVFKQFSFIGYYLKDNTASGAGRWFKGEDVVVTLHPGGQWQESTYRVDERGNLKDILHQGEYDGTREPWYVNTVKAGKPVWNRVYTAQTYPGYISASANAPIYDRNGSLLGVVGIDLLLAEISKFLQNIHVSPGTQIAIFERDGRLIASSGRETVFFQQGETWERWTVFNTPNPTLRSVARQITAKFETLRSLQSPQQFNFTADGQQHYISIFPWQDRYGLDWLVLIVIPEADFAANIATNSRNTILLCLGALAIAILAGSYTARWIARPIFTLGKASRAIATGDIKQQVPPSHILELDGVGQAFNRMAARVEQSLNALERNNRELENRVAERTGELSDKNAQLQAALEELHRTQARVIQAEKMSALGNLVAGVAHEINNPISFIHGNLNYLKVYAQNLLELEALYRQNFTPLPEAVEDHLESIDFDFLREDIFRLLASMGKGTERIRDLVLSLRHFAHLDEAEMKFVDVHRGLASALALVQNRLEATAKRPAIRVVEDYAELPAVQCYAAQLNQVFLHLLSNAIDAFDEGSLPPREASDESRLPTIVLRTEMQGRDRIHIEICDNGPGIAEANQPRIFDPFFSTKPVGRGPGLGLTICYQIISEQHGGELACTSTPGEGACFSVEIPLQPKTRG